MDDDDLLMSQVKGGSVDTEIATVLGLPAGTVKGRMRLGLHKLREAIDLVAA